MLTCRINPSFHYFQNGIVSPDISYLRSTSRYLIYKNKYYDPFVAEHRIHVRYTTNTPFGKTKICT